MSCARVYYNKQNTIYICRRINYIITIAFEIMLGIAYKLLLFYYTRVVLCVTNNNIILFVRIYAHAECPPKYVRN